MTDNEAATYQRPANLTYAVDSGRHPASCCCSAFNTPLLDAPYLVLVAIIVRRLQCLD